MDRRGTARRRRGVVALAGAVAAVLAAVAAVGGAGPASAHSEVGELTVIVAEQSGDQVHVEVGITFADDGHLAEEATVSATLAGPGGEVGPVPLEQISGGRYGADVAVPDAGPWVVVVTSSGPEASAEQPVAAAAPTTAGEGAPTTTTAPPATAPPTTVVDADLAASTGEPSSGTSPVVWVLAALGALVVVVAVGVGVARSGRRARGG